MALMMSKGTKQSKGNREPQSSSTTPRMKMEALKRKNPKTSRTLMD